MESAGCGIDTSERTTNGSICHSNILFANDCHDIWFVIIQMCDFLQIICYIGLLGDCKFPRISNIAAVIYEWSKFQHRSIDIWYVGVLGTASSTVANLMPWYLIAGIFNVVQFCSSLVNRCMASCPGDKAPSIQTNFPHKQTV